MTRSTSDTTSSTNRLPHSQALRLLDAAAAASGDPCFHLRCAAHLDAVDLGFLATLLATAPTVGEAIARVQRYGRLLHDRCHQWAEERDGLYYWFTELEGMSCAASLAECLAAATVTRLRLRLGPTWAPRQVWFRHAPQASDDVYARAFGCGLRHGAPYDGLVLDASILALPNADPGVLSTLAERHGVRGRWAPDSGPVLRLDSCGLKEHNPGRRQVHVEQDLHDAFSGTSTSCARQAA